MFELIATESAYVRDCQLIVGVSLKVSSSVYGELTGSTIYFELSALLRRSDEHTGRQRIASDFCQHRGHSDDIDSDA